MQPTTLEEIKQVRQSCGFFFMDGWSILTANGKETFSFLQTQTTNDALQLEVGQGQASAVTDRQARLIANFSIHRIDENDAWLLSENSQLCTTIWNPIISEKILLLRKSNKVYWLFKAPKAP